MKYKVSLLPEKNRKRINSKKKAEQVKVISLIALGMMLVLLFVSVSFKFLADSVLLKENEKNAAYADVVIEISENGVDWQRVYKCQWYSLQLYT